MKTRSMAAAATAAFLLCCLTTVFAQSRPTARRPAAAKTTATKPAPAAEPVATTNTRPAVPKLILVLVVDQFRADYLDRFHTEYGGGLKRLLDESAVFGDAHYNHSPTITAVGHSITLTGAMPSSSGIVGNEWYDRVSGKQVTSVNDASTTQLGGESGKEGASPHRLLVSTVGDELKMSEKWPASKVFGISVKDRAAIMMAGRRADGAFWWDATTGNFVSSTYYFNQLPQWAAEFNKSRAADKFVGQNWGPATGGTPFMMLPSTAGPAYWTGVVGTSYGNDLLVMMAKAAIDGEKLGQRDSTDLLAVSFSSCDTIGHRKGPHSPEIHDVALSTDKVLADLFAYLEKSVGMKNVLVAFTADHGVAPMPEYNQRFKMPGGRAAAKDVRDTVQKALVAKYGPGEWVSGYSGPAPYLNHQLIASKKLALDDVQDTAAAAARQLPYIARVFTREDLRRGMTHADLVGARVQNGFFYLRASDLFIVPNPYWLFEASGTSHGTPWNYDSHVPLMIMGPQIKPGRYYQRVLVNDLAPTLTAIAGVEIPSGASGRVLHEIITANK
ncbi:MAG TPA: alkaline phosphatase family protein [Bryobacteraceae bacterium]|nr:alkaline phosphatase family protein [Bryobacteraceae bacterium]HPT25227.1 alkaline phosphatase family protein [Bryobacteraceae bacterium]